MNTVVIAPSPSLTSLSLYPFGREEAPRRDACESEDVSSAFRASSAPFARSLSPASYSIAIFGAGAEEAGF